MLRFVNPTALPMVHCYSIRLPRGVAILANYSRHRTESSSEHYASDLSLHMADAYLQISGARIRTHDLWIRDRKRVSYTLHHSGPFTKLN